MNIDIPTKQEIRSPFYDHVFKCGDTMLTRRDLESFPCPFCTENVSNEVMISIVSEIDKELKLYRYNLKQNPEELEEEHKYNLYYEMDIAAVKFNVPYYEDIRKNAQL